MLIKIPEFTGMMPRISSDNLPDGAASYALDCNFNSGSIEGIREPKHSIASASASAIKGGFIYSDAEVGKKVFNFAYDVDGVRSPVSSDTHKRFYWTGKNGATPEFRFSKAGDYQSDHIGPVGEPATTGTVVSKATYKVGVINSAGWDNTMQSLGLEPKVVAKGFATQLTDLTNDKIGIYLADANGKLAHELAHGVDYSVAWADSTEEGKWPTKGFNITLHKNIDSYNQVKGPGNVTYTIKAGVSVSVGLTGAQYKANVFYVGTEAKYIQLTQALVGLDQDQLGTIDATAEIFLHEEEEYEDNITNAIESGG